MFEIHYGFFHRLRVLASELQPGTDLLIGDEVDHHAADRSSLFFALAPMRNGQTVLLDKVTSIVLQSAPPLP